MLLATGERRQRGNGGTLHFEAAPAEKAALPVIHL
jgi:hypothetical protein